LAGLDGANKGTGETRGRLKGEPYFRGAIEWEEGGCGGTAKSGGKGRRQQYIVKVMYLLAPQIKKKIRRKKKLN